MTKGKAIFVVGHKNWGKSETLKALTGGNWRLKWFQINTEWFFFQRMSNDDIPNEFYDRLDKLDPEEKPLIIVALCPTFERQRNRLIQSLKEFAKKYDIFFFVLRNAYKDRERRQISATEIEHLEKLGTVKTFAPMDAESGERAKSLARFVNTSLKQSKT